MPYIQNGLVPLREEFLFPLEKKFDEFYNSFFKTGLSDSVKASAGYPKWDIYQDDGYLIVKAAIPGVKPEDLEVSVEDLNISEKGAVRNGNFIQTQDWVKVLRISGKTAEEHRQSKTANAIIKELRLSAFTREAILPEWVKDDPEAVFKDGILKLSWKMPNEKKEVSSIKKIAIKSD